MKRPVKLSVVRSERDGAYAKQLRGDMYHHIESCVRDAGDKLAGYALVLWDKDGMNWSTLRGGGPVKSRLVPTFVSDALNQHVAVDMAAEDRRK